MSYKEFLDQVIYESYPKRPVGGQNVGTMYTGVTLKCPETGFQVSVVDFRSQLKNKQMCISLYMNYLSKLKYIDDPIQTVVNNGTIGEQTNIENHIGDLKL